MSEEKSKNKNIKRLPSYIQYSVILWYFINSMVLAVLALIPGGMGKEIPRNMVMVILVVIPPISGFIVGWSMKFHYARQQDDEALSVRMKAQFWGAMAFLVAFIISLLLIFISLITLESNDFLPESLAEPITFTIAMLILAISLWIANNTKNRIYRNFNQE